MLVIQHARREGKSFLEDQCEKMRAALSQDDRWVACQQAGIDVTYDWEYRDGSYYLTWRVVGVEYHRNSEGVIVETTCSP